MKKFEKINIVCFGGGTGLSSLLAGLKHNPWLNLTAVVNVFDNGGSSGELRDRFGILPPGDVLKCILALAEDDASARKILLKRIENERSPGHTGGNVLLMGLEKVYGDYEDAVRALGQILSAKGEVVPVATEQSAICAKYKDKSVSRGEVGVDVGISDGREIEEIFLDPPVRASNAAVRAIKKADVLCVGPGSFYTSVLPNFLPKGIKDEITRSQAPIIFISNLLTEGLGMKSYTTDKMTGALESYIGRNVAAVVVNAGLPKSDVLARYVVEEKHPLLSQNDSETHYELVAADLWSDTSIARHDSALLANIIFALVNKLLKK